MAGYHKKEIPRGEFGEFSKIREEMVELEDAYQQGNSIMVLNEMSDIMGAIEAYTTKYHNISLDDLIMMKDATKRAFLDGHRTPKTN